MRFALVDSEGATVDSFESAADLRRELRRSLREEPDSDAIAGLFVLEYREGQRVGEPLEAMDFLASDLQNVLAVARSVGSGDLCQSVRIGQVQRVAGDPDSIPVPEIQLSVAGRVESNVVAFLARRPPGRRQVVIHA